MGLCACCSWSMATECLQSQPVDRRTVRYPRCLTDICAPPAWNRTTFMRIALPAVATIGPDWPPASNPYATAMCWCLEARPPRAVTCPPGQHGEGSVGSKRRPACADRKGRSDRHHDRIRPHGVRNLPTLAEFERDLIRERTMAGLAAARARGRKGGRKFALTKAQVRLAQAAMAQRDTSVSDLCKELGIERDTLYRYVGPKGELRDYGKRVLGLA